MPIPASKSSIIFVVFLLLFVYNFVLFSVPFLTHSICAVILPLIILILTVSFSYISIFLIVYIELTMLKYLSTNVVQLQIGQ